LAVVAILLATCELRALQPVEVRIPMRDGVRLAADLWRPDEGQGPWPVLLEYLPYRKTEARGGSFRGYEYFVRAGYVVARVDIRGTGNSEGTLIPYEYSEIEQRDGEDVIAWLAAQPFSTGKVGMFGISWGGFNSIHMAMRRPSALKAIIAVDATDDLYQDDVHFMDGIMHVDSWEMSQDLHNAVPGAPDYVIDERYFRERFDQPPWMLTYKGEQRDGPFWDRTALNKRYESIQIPVFMIGGWYDGYRDSIPRMLEKVKAPTKAIVGAWDHTYPDEPYPKPGFDWRREAVRWFDQWLKGRDTGILKEPRLAVYVREWHPPGPYLDTAPGRWRWEDGWPIARIRERVLYPRPDRSLEDAAGEGVDRLRYVPTTGVEAGGPVMWWGDVAPDQRPTDAFSLVYDTAPLGEDVEILGLPKAMLRVAADAPHLDWYAKLNDVAPDGTVTLVAGAGMNGAHRASAREPRALEPGKPFELEIEMHFASWIFPKGHRIRLSVSNAQWPMNWPTPYPATASLYLGKDASRLLLPVVPPGGPERPAPSWQPIPEKGTPLPGYEAIAMETPSAYGEISSVDRNPRTGKATVLATNNSAQRYPWGEERNTEKITHEAEDGHPEKASVRGEYSKEIQLPNRILRFESVVTFSSDRQSFRYQGTRKLFENGTLLREKSWDKAFPRDFQ
jgi:predicted acyl esterase